MPEISVIMAVYNLPDESVLGASIASILQQTYRDFELLICDDGSTDQTWQILKKYARIDNRIQLLRSRRNRKAGWARNACIQKARGTYIAVMDADDLSAPARLEKQYLFLESHSQYAFAGCRGEFFVQRPGDDGEKYWYCKKPKPEDFLFSLPFVHASIMFRKEALEQVNGYDSSRRAVRVEDYDLLLRMYAQGMRGANLPQVLYYCRRDEKQYQRRKYRYRFHEAGIRCRGFYKLHMLPGAWPYVVKPLFVGLIPVCLTKRIQKKYYSKKQDGT